MHFTSTIFVALTLLIACDSRVLACPFCRPVKTTFTEDINAADVAVLGELVSRPQRPDTNEGEIPAADIIDSYKTTFKIQKVYQIGRAHV